MERRGMHAVAWRASFVALHCIAKQAPATHRLNFMSAKSSLHSSLQESTSGNALVSSKCQVDQQFAAATSS